MDTNNKKPGFNLFGYKFVSGKSFDAYVSRLVGTIDKKVETIKERDQEILSLREENRSLRRTASTFRQFIDPNLNDPEPIDTQKRKEYVATVAGFHRTILANKILFMIGTVRSQLEKFDSTIDKNGNRLSSFSAREFDWILKGTLNALWLMYDWGDSMTKEQTADQHVSAEDLNTLKEIVT